MRECMNARSFPKIRVVYERSLAFFCSPENWGDDLYILMTNAFKGVVRPPTSPKMRSTLDKKSLK